jgi:hypothetical protein
MPCNKPSDEEHRYNNYALAKMLKENPPKDKDKDKRTKTKDQDKKDKDKRQR